MSNVFVIVTSFFHLPVQFPLTQIHGRFIWLAQ